MKINDVLDKNKIEYEREYVVRYYSVDNYLINSGLMIEVMGDYWHVSPLKYSNGSGIINKTQKKILYMIKVNIRM